MGEELSYRIGISKTVEECNWIEATPPEHIKGIFAAINIKPEDILVDIGCGDGDIIQHWIDMGLTNKIIGKELDIPTYFNTKARFLSYPNVAIERGDASSSPPKGTLYYLFNPFIGSRMRAFEQAIPRTARIIYFKPVEIGMFNNWKVEEIWPKPPKAVLISGA